MIHAEGARAVFGLRDDKTANEPRLKRRLLFDRIGRHLLEDGGPSEAVGIGREPAFAEYPFSMLLRLKSTNSRRAITPRAASGTIPARVDAAAKRGI
jgi:hypothetical protein